MKQSSYSFLNPFAYTVDNICILSLEGDIHGIIEMETIFSKSVILFFTLTYPTSSLKPKISCFYKIWPLPLLPFLLWTKFCMSSKSLALTSLKPVAANRKQKTSRTPDKIPKDLARFAREIRTKNGPCSH